MGTNFFLIIEKCVYHCACCYVMLNMLDSLCAKNDQSPFPLHHNMIGHLKKFLHDFRVGYLRDKYTGP